MARLLVTCPPPPRDRDIDVSAFTTIYLAADIFTRARRLLGDEASLVTVGPVEGPAATSLARAGIAIQALDGGQGPQDCEAVLFAGNEEKAIAALDEATARIAPSTGKTRAVRLAPLVNRGHTYAVDRGHCIWMADLLDAVPVEALRFYLALMGPDESVRDLEVPDMQRTVDLFLAGDLSASAAKAAELDAEAMGRLPSDPALDDFLGYMRDSYTNAVTVDGFALASLGNALLGINGQLKQSRIDEAYGQLPRLLALFSLLSRPLMPGFADQLGDFLGLTSRWGSDWLHTGGAVPPVSPGAISGPPPRIATVDAERLGAIENRLREHAPTEA